MFTLLWKFWQTLFAAYTIIIYLFLSERFGRGYRLKAFSFSAVGPSDSEDLLQPVSTCHRNSAPIDGDSFGSIPMTRSWTKGRTGKTVEGIWDIFSLLIPRETFKRTKLFFLFGLRAEAVAWPPGPKWWGLSTGREELPPTLEGLLENPPPASCWTS